MKKGKRKVNKLKLHNSTRTFLTIVFLVLFAVSTTNIYKSLFEDNLQKTEKQLYSYTNNYNLDYKVNIKDNKFILDKSLPKDQTYISDLIKNLDVDIDYSYIASKKTDVKYNYTISAIIGASYTQDGENYKVWEKEYPLKKVENQENNGDINIKENVKVDYQLYNSEVKEFKQVMGMALDAYLYIQIDVNTETEVENKDVKNEYKSDFNISLGDKVAKVSGKTVDQKTGYVTEEIVENQRNMFIIVFNLVIAIMSVYAIYYVRTKTKIARNVKNYYRLELNRILKSCQDRIVVVKNKFEIEKENTIDVQDFGELIKLSEELFKPILYWDSNEVEEAWFCVLSNSVTYRYVLKKNEDVA